MCAAQDDDRTVGRTGEFAVIDRITAGRGQAPTTIVGPGDDAALITSPDGRVVATTDMLVEGRHFRLDWSTPRDIGHKAIAQNGADIASMGAVCTAFLVALGCPAGTPMSVIEELNEGLWREATRAGGSIVGGDLVASEQLVISITALGDLQGREPVLRSGARDGDVVAVAGELGRSAAGLALLDAGVDCGADDALAALVRAHRTPLPPYGRGPEAADAGASALTDISDGLIADLGHLARASGVRIALDRAALTPSDPMVRAASLLGADAGDWVLTGGEDHALVGCFRTPPPSGWTVVGAVRPGSGVVVDGVGWDRPGGWESY
ncbi:thiamine-phosphate kinase [Speluncibacter jeojiensis]|uniref:Thiamine-monophosphate kinase n=1 Tax=Speluncibacter jeojiensis TaxID=2710754 RepID=A0A9X4LX90_9ACTN|nr:thiamine-phosphate kinase [Corynebacteriales bacterium D3-21]